MRPRVARKMKFHRQRSMHAARRTGEREAEKEREREAKKAANRRKRIQRELAGRIYEVNKFREKRNRSGGGPRAAISMGNRAAVAPSGAIIIELARRGETMGDRGRDCKKTSAPRPGPIGNRVFSARGPRRTRLPVDLPEIYRDTSHPFASPGTRYRVQLSFNFFSLLTLLND